MIPTVSLKLHKIFYLSLSSSWLMRPNFLFKFSMKQSDEAAARNISIFCFYKFKEVALFLFFFWPSRKQQVFPSACFCLSRHLSIPSPPNRVRQMVALPGSGSRRGPPVKTCFLSTVPCESIFYFFTIQTIKNDFLFFKQQFEIKPTQIAIKHICN